MKKISKIAGIGSRKTPNNIIEIIHEISKRLNDYDIIFDLSNT